VKGSDRGGGPDPATLAFFARCNGFPRTLAWLFLPDYHELVAATLLHAHSWSGDEPGLAFSEWLEADQNEMVEVLAKIPAPVIVKLSGAPTPQVARNGRGSGLQ
jgi:hypothetical protein